VQSLTLLRQCDGRHPICSRCEGYGFTCSWSKRRTRPTHTAQDGADGQARDGRLFDSPTSRTIPQPKDQLPALSGAIELYENLIHRLRSTLDSANHIALNRSLQDIRRLIPQEVQEAQTNRQTSDHGEPHGSSGGISSASPRTYVGKASDLHFIHSIRQYVHGQEPSPGEDTAIQNYSQSPIVDGLAAALKHPMLIPARENADKYLEVYLSTIHIAYPFISKQHLLDAYQYFWTAKSNHPDFHPWLAILSKAPPLNKTASHSLPR
jgi:Fungal Zn(2)-Cys(6) binuclear cluster domain